MAEGTERNQWQDVPGRQLHVKTQQQVIGQTQNIFNESLTFWQKLCMPEDFRNSSLSFPKQANEVILRPSSPESDSSKVCTSPIHTEESYDASFYCSMNLNSIKQSKCKITTIDLNENYESTRTAGKSQVNNISGIVNSALDLSLPKFYNEFGPDYRFVEFQNANSGTKRVNHVFNKKKQYDQVVNISNIESYRNQHYELQKITGNTNVDVQEVPLNLCISKATEKENFNTAVEFTENICGGIKEAYSIITGETPKRSTEFANCKRKISELNEVILEVPFEEADYKVIDDCVMTQKVSLVPDDLPILTNPRVIVNTGANKKNSIADNWVHTVRRRLLPISTLLTMFGIGDSGMITLICGGKGVVNPRESNIPTPATPKYQCFFKCQFCQRVFRTRRALGRHLLSHTTYKKIYCVVCWRGFYDACDLKRHAKLHAEIQVHYCEDCAAIYTQNVSSEDHIKNIHPYKNIVTYVAGN